MVYGISLPQKVILKGNQSCLCALIWPEPGLDQGHWFPPGEPPLSPPADDGNVGNWMVVVNIVNCQVGLFPNRLNECLLEAKGNPALKDDPLIIATAHSVVNDLTAFNS